MPLAGTLIKTQFQEIRSHTAIDISTPGLLPATGISTVLYFAAKVVFGPEE